MKTVNVRIPEDVRDDIQALQFEVESRKDLLAHMINTGVDTTSDGFKRYEKEYQEFFVKYNIAKEDMQNKILKPAIQGTLLSWNLDFSTCEAVCTYEA